MALGPVTGDVIRVIMFRRLRGVSGNARKYSPREDIDFGDFKLKVQVCKRPGGN